MADTDVVEQSSGEVIDHDPVDVEKSETVSGEVVDKDTFSYLTTYADQDDVTSYIKSLGVLNPDAYETAFDLMNPGLKAKAAADAWEQLVCWHPYLSTGKTDEMRRFDPPGPNKAGWGRGGGKQLELKSGLLELTNLQTNMSTLFNSTTVLQPDLDYWLLDQAGNYDPVAHGKCIEVIEFTTPQYGVRASVHVTGEWGRYRLLPANVWLAIRHYAAYLCFAELALSISRGLFSFKDLNVEIRYASGRITPLAVEAQTWYKAFHDLATQEARFTM